MLKNALMAGVALLTLSGAAYAADLPVKGPIAPAYLPTSFTWSGLYVGIHGGWEFSAFDPGIDTGSTVPSVATGIAALTNPGSIGANANGGFVGGHIGFNVQQGQLVFGPRFDIDLSGLAGTQANPAAITGMGGSIINHSITWHGDGVLKLGYLLTPQTLFYGVGGVAFGEIKDSASVDNLALSGVTFCGTVTAPTATCALSSENVHVGWTAGLGIEHAITPNILVGLEWDYTNLGHHGVVFTNTPVTGLTNTFNVDDKAAWNSVKGTFTFKF